MTVVMPRWSDCLSSPRTEYPFASATQLEHPFNGVGKDRLVREGPASRPELDGACPSQLPPHRHPVTGRLGQQPRRQGDPVHTAKVAPQK